MFQTEQRYVVINILYIYVLTMYICNPYIENEFGKFIISPD